MSSAAPVSRSPIEELLRPVDRMWWLWVVFGVLSVLAGIVALVNPGLSLLAIAILFGCYLIVSGFFDVLAGTTADDVDTLRRILAVLLGILSLIAGILVLLRPGAGLVALVLIVGVYLVVSGVIQLAAAISDDLGWLTAGLGLVNLILGIIILAVPGLGLVTFAILFGAGLVVRGAVAIAAGLQLRRLAKPAETRTQPTSTMRPASS